mmetsp:Transcript_44808/g.126820  ORF Transcript_44808/g.126820 Transcript_44808/m.126820 type:complete len:200 (+) Transcript_44808:834-1433(+)
MVVLDLPKSDLGHLVVGIRHEHREHGLLEDASSLQPIHKVEVVALRHGPRAEAQYTIKLEGAKGHRTLVGRKHQGAAAADRPDADLLLHAAAPDLARAEGDRHLVLGRRDARGVRGAVAADLLKGRRLVGAEARMLHAGLVPAFLRGHEKVATARVENDQEGLPRRADCYPTVIGRLVDDPSVAGAVAGVSVLGDDPPF